MYRFTLSIILILALLPFFAGCQSPKVKDLQKRLDVFRYILPQELRVEFDSKNYEKVVRGIDSLLQVDENFKTRYENMKDEEAINVFTPQEVIDFFKTYFVEEIEKEQKRESGFRY